MVKTKSIEKELLEARSKLHTVLRMARAKKKTVKWKACVRSCSMLLDRVEGLIKIIQTGGNGPDVCVAEDPVIIKMMYEDIVNFWRGELEK